MQSVQEWVKAITAKTDFEVRRRHSGLRPDARYGINMLSYLVDEHVAKVGHGAMALLQVGANDGKDEDSVNPILAKHPIRSLLCEPLSGPFAQLEREYEGSPHVRVVQRAIGAEDGFLELHHIAGDDESAAASKIASASREHVAKFLEMRGRPEESLAVERVPARTVATLLAENGLEHVDILVSDCEGMDHVVCGQALSLPKPPTILQFEYHNIPIADSRALMDRLTDMDYLFVRSGLDIIALRSDAAR